MQPGINCIMFIIFALWIWKSDQTDSDSKSTILDFFLHYTSTPPRLRYLFQVVQTQTTTAYCRISPILAIHWTTTFEISFSGSSDTNHDSLL